MGDFEMLYLTFLLDIWVYMYLSSWRFKSGIQVGFPNWSYVFVSHLMIFGWCLSHETEWDHKSIAILFYTLEIYIYVDLIYCSLLLWWWIFATLHICVVCTRNVMTLHLWFWAGMAKHHMLFVPDVAPQPYWLWLIILKLSFECKCGQAKET